MLIKGLPQSLVPTSVLFRGFMAVKRHHGYSNSFKGKHLIDVAAYRSDVQSIITMMWSMAACRET